jgi:hypothetical protein
MPTQKMPKKMDGSTETTFKVSLSKGMATRYRLPLPHVIKVLTELYDAVRDAGRAVQRERGSQIADGDFGIELLATGEGIVFQKGSVTAEAAITRDVHNGAEAVRRVMHTMSTLERKRPASIGQGEENTVRRLSLIADIQKKDRVELSLVLNTPQRKNPETALFGDAGIATTDKISASEATVEDMTLYGRLRELRDKSQRESGGKSFWGELLTDDEQVWRLHFKSKDEKYIVPLFRKRVVVNGDAIYYKAFTPRLDVSEIKPQKTRDYEAAFKALYGIDKDVYGKEDFDALIAEMRGDD